MALNIPTEMVEEFCAFVDAFFGVKPKVHDKPKRGEYARFRVGSSFVFVREHDDLSRDAATLEVFSSDVKRVEEIEKAWLPYLNSKFAEAEDGSGNETNGSGTEGGEALPESGNG